MLVEYATPIINIDDQLEQLTIKPSQVESCSTLRSINQPSPFHLPPCDLQSSTNDTLLTNKTIWQHLRLNNTSDMPLKLWLSIGHPLINDIRIWQNNGSEVYKLGLNVPLEETPIKLSPFVVPIDFTANKQIEIMIGYSSKSFINTNIQLWQPDAYLQDQTQKTVKLSLTIGALLLSLLLSITVIIWRKKNIYLWLSILIASEIAFLLTTSGIEVIAHNIEYSHIYQSLPLIISLLNIFFYILLAYLLQRKIEKSKVIYFTKWSINISLIGLIFIKLVSTSTLFTATPEIYLPIEMSAWLLLVGMPLIIIIMIFNERQLEQKIQKHHQENTLKTNFLREVNHEIRAPLNRILTQALEIDRPSLRDKIIQNCHHVLLTIDEALRYNNTITTADLNKNDLEVLSWSSFIDILTQSGQEIIERTYKEQKNLFILNCQFIPFNWIMVDDRRLLQVIDNLLTNAARYTQNGKIQLNISGRLLAEETNQTSRLAEVSISIRDTGVGISQEEQASIFEPFTRGKAGKNSSHKGIGMGLAIVKQLMDQLNGSIALTSKEGKGTQIILTLPLYEATSEFYDNHQKNKPIDIPLPTLEEMKHLEQLTQQGAISEIIRWSNQLAQTKPELIRFTQEVLDSAIKGDLGNLRKLAKQIHHT